MTRLDSRTVLYLTLPPMLWAGNALVGRMAVGVVSPMLLNALRWMLAALVLLPLGWRVLRPGSTLWRRWRRFLALGLLGVGCYNALQYWALETSPPINVTLIASSMPVWMLAVGALFHGEHPRRAQVVGAVLSLAGVLVVLSRGDWATLMQVRLAAGDLIMVLAVILWAFYSWMLARPSDRSAAEWHWAEFLLAQVVFGLLWTTLAVGGEYLAGRSQLQWSPWVLVLLAYITLGPSIIAFRCWGLGVSLAGPTVAAFFNNLTPLFAAVLSAAVLGEAPHLYHGVAFALIVGGIVASARR
jgi:drug/metabolite transporter (DMT)-like permease